MMNSGKLQKFVWLVNLGKFPIPRYYLPLKGLNQSPLIPIPSAFSCFRQFLMSIFYSNGFNNFPDRGGEVFMNQEEFAYCGLNCSTCKDRFSNVRSKMSDLETAFEKVNMKEMAKAIQSGADQSPQVIR